MIKSITSSSNPHGLDLKGKKLKPTFVGLLMLLSFLFGTQIIIAQPTITSFTPLRDTVGATVLISGTNFNTTTANNVVFFGATRATVTSATATSLTVTVPIGSTFAPITVLNTSTALATYSTQYFNPIFSPSKGNITVDDIAVGVNITTGLTPQSIANGDIDGDGKPDLVIANTYGSVSILRNIGSNGTFAFATKVDFGTGLSPKSVAIGDINGDGKLDLAIANSSSNTISILRNISSIGNISFNTKVDFTAAQGPQSVAISDLDGDGKLDLAIANYNYANGGMNPGNIVSVFRNTGNISTISFATKVDFASNSGPLFIAIGDIDGNGKPDIAVATAIGSVSILRNTSSIGILSFASKVDFGANSNPQSVAVGDIDGDGKQDLAVANGSNFISVLRNTSIIGSVTFATRLDLPTAQSQLKSIVIGDLNGDGKLDLISGNSSGNSVSILKNKSSIGTISFESKLDFGVGANPISLVIGDINGDGKPDLMAANNGGNSIGILRNNPQPFPPKIISIIPTIGKEGDTVSIIGKYFNNFPANNVVFFGANQATVSSSTDTTLTVIVPSGATFAPITVLNVSTTFSASSLQYFNPIYSPNKDSITSADIAPKVDFVTGSTPTSVAIGDIDGDGKSDMVIVNNYSNSVSVLLNTGSNGTVSFAPKVDFVTGIAPISVAIGDLNGDGKLDLVVVNNSGNSISVLRNTSSGGTISFATKVDIVTGQVYSICIGDLDGDGRPDLVTNYVSNNRVVIWRNIGNINNINFTGVSTSTSTGTSPISIAIGDMDGDGKPDLITANNYGSGLGGNSVSILRNTSSITFFSFAPKVDIGTGAAPQSVAIGDLNGDGKLDIAIANYGNNTVSLFANTSSIDTLGFAPKIDFTTGSNPTQVTIGDINGDGKPDLATSNSGSNTVSILRNIGNSSTISFYNKVDFTTSSSPNSVAIGDINGDGKPDLALANTGSNTVSVLSNNSQLPPTINTLGTLNPFIACIGKSSAQQTFKISGVGLSSNLLLTASLDFEISTTSGFGFGDTVSLTPIYGTVINTLIYIRIKSSAIGSPSGNVVCTSTGATTKNIAVRGVVNAVSITTSTSNISICSNSLPYIWNGRTYNSNSTDTIYLANSLGCDSVTILILTIKSTSTSTNIVNICSSALPFTWNGRTYYSNITDTVYLANSIGCDSLAILKLIVKPISTSSNNISICTSLLPFTWNSKVYNASAIDTVILTNTVGCDSLAILKLTVKSISTSTNIVSICPSALPYTWNSRTYNSNRTDTVYLTNSVGCDSLAILKLTVNPIPFTSNITGLTSVARLDTATYSVTGLSGSVFNWVTTKGLVQKGAGTYQIKVKWNIAGVDSIKVIETSTQGCVGTQKTLLVNIGPATSMNEINTSNNILVYPNPFNETIFISLLNNSGLNKAILFDLLGKEVLTTQKSEIDASSLKSGIYLIMIVDNNGNSYSEKLVKN